MVLGPTLTKSPKSFRKWFLKIYRIFAQTRKIVSEKQIRCGTFSVPIPYYKYGKNLVFDTFFVFDHTRIARPLTKPFSIDKDTSLLLLLLQIDRFENYDQDVEILTHTDIPSL
ncbi:hypothetical protein LEP1GSC036_0571 [Leptospira weilii str. 2006001853]|uniref:Uncharacterized protein n=1 Tax=Leptospira weilii str. 2006001853 TaxID=1001589 RepID=A0A828Z195_9LEPT|nr:hypothetical protein [Leptospira weilii]EKR64045.1 hypothetical protein LEP1GSC036_0571 [Leptospira weilii str. 2006001853]QDK22098.1 hypothetical protein FHG67_04620 [Leptospira weilii]QDK26038.1 hypothetical protein FHG68_04475 [Leptospira weilii]